MNLQPDEWHCTSIYVKTSPDFQGTVKVQVPGVKVGGGDNDVVIVQSRRQLWRRIVRAWIY